MNDDFSLSGFYKQGLLGSVGHMPDYQIINRATEQYESGLLSEQDLMDVHKAIKRKNEVRNG